MKIPRIDPNSPLPLTFDDQKRKALYGCIQHPGYQVLLQLMESRCIKQDIILRQVPIDDEKAILGEHRVCNAMWDFFASIQNQVEREIKELFGETGESEEELSDEQRLINRVADPLQNLTPHPDETE